MMWLKMKDGRHARREGRDEALLLPHRPVLRAPADHPQGDRVRPGDGPGHDPGRPRGRPGQIELNFNFDRAENTADNLSTYRQICRQVGRELGAFPCFMPKPFMGVSANGCHHNISLWRGRRERLHARHRRSPEAEPDRPLRDRRHPRAPRRADRVTASTVNSYRRLWDTGFWAPVFADWGYQNRTTALRVSAPGRSSTARSTRRSTRTSRWPCSSPRWRTGSTGSSTRASPRSATSTRRWPEGKEVKKIPMTFGDALDALEADDVIRGAMPGEIYKCVHALQAGRVGAVLRHRQRLGRRGVPRRASVTDGARRRAEGACAASRGSSTRTATSRRGRDDADAPVDEAPRPRLDRLRALRHRRERLARDALQARRREHAARLRLRGAAAAAPARGRGPARPASAPR